MFNGTQFLSVQVNNNSNFNLQLFMSLNVDQGAHLEDSLAPSARDAAELPPVGPGLPPADGDQKNS